VILQQRSWVLSLTWLVYLMHAMQMAVADATGLTNLAFSLYISSFTLYWWL
jgi:hypothetical protein